MRIKERIIPILTFFKENSKALKEFVDIKVSDFKNHFREIKEYWQNNPDQRLSQVLFNLGIVKSDKNYHTEEDDWLIEKGYLQPRDIKFWGKNFDKNNKRLDKTEFILIKDLSTEHIHNIFAWFRNNRYNPLTEPYNTYLKEELVLRDKPIRNKKKVK